ncbi:MAG TPA: hypothetical protein VF614_01135 [Chthoniobacteraceae bacterium]
MKKILLALLLTLGALGFAPQAEAGGYGGRYERGYDRGYERDCRPVRRYSHYRHYHAPVVYHRVRHRYYADDYYCAPRVRYYSRPRVAFHIGF